MELDYKALGFWLQLAQAVITGMVFVYVWLTSRQKANTAAIDKLREDLHGSINALDDRLIRVERDVDHLPTHDDMSKLHTRVNEANENIKEMRGTLGQLNHTLQLMHQHMLNGGK
ncbi:DUF2730 family protein [Parathalassolituus penaei]|uniref:DUF2730 family protein n=1 Tax=Parathalassolituus penaei TaxID=2997323 RepID=A0A9X3EF72_9GAMM|nr:DUF2730 family protein [Parathalassolituus penaei]MCY0966146.1 DUF2730 family protein [Parathalassolituus penaei]